MGGDNAPREIVKGAVEAVRKRKDIKVLLTGKEDVIRKELSAYTYPEEQIEIVNATEVIETAEPPVKAIRGKKDSSIVVAMKMVKKGEADAFVDVYKRQAHVQQLLLLQLNMTDAFRWLIIREFQLHRSSLFWMQ